MNRARPSAYYKPEDFEEVANTDCLAGFVSLCTGGGVGDTGIERSATPLKLAVAVEAHRNRARVLQRNFPKARVIQGDISSGKVKRLVYRAVEEAFGTRRPFALLMTPPCQGWSPSGQGRLRKNGEWEPESDARNLVVRHCLKITSKVSPEWVVFENVPHVRAKEIRLRNRVVSVLTYLRNRLEELGYVVHESPPGTNAANYGIPQNRPRIFVIAERLGLPDGLVFPPASHVNPRATTKLGSLPSWVTLREALGPGSHRGTRLLGRLDGGRREKLADPEDPHHRIPAVNPDHYRWIRDLAPGATAFDNHVCPNPDCGFVDPDPDWKRDTRCGRCETTLNKPLVRENGKLRVIKGRRTSYTRMSWEKEAPTVTCSSGTLSSDTKVHPTENRVLSLREVMILQTIEEDSYDWDAFEEPYRSETVPNGVEEVSRASDPFIRTLIGEAIPPAWSRMLFERIWETDQELRRLRSMDEDENSRDMFAPKKRSEVMRSIRSTNTQFERDFRSCLWRRGVRGYRVHWKPAGAADLAWPGLKVAVFLDGDFWHGWDWENLKPKLKNDFWVKKIERTIERDRATTERLERQGWKVLRFWGHDVLRDPKSCAEQIEKAVHQRRGNPPS